MYPVGHQHSCHRNTTQRTDACRNETTSCDLETARQTWQDACGSKQDILNRPKTAAVGEYSMQECKNGQDLHASRDDATAVLLGLAQISCLIVRGDGQ